jgi:hypothetical protein
MKNKLLLPVLFATAMAAAGVASAAPTFQEVVGSAAASNSSVDQVIVITDTTRYVNVNGGTTVRFVVGDKSFTWTFQNGTAHVDAFDLSAIAPKGLLTHAVKAYVGDSPAYRNS